jgi:hypothetical protein
MQVFSLKAVYSRREVAFFFDELPSQPSRAINDKGTHPLVQRPHCPYKVIFSRQNMSYDSVVLRGK